MPALLYDLRRELQQRELKRAESDRLGHYAVAMSSCHALCGSLR